MENDILAKKNCVTYFLASLFIVFVIVITTFLIVDSLIGRILGVIIGFLVSLVFLSTFRQEDADNKGLISGVSSRFPFAIWPVLLSFFALFIVMAIPHSPSAELFQEPLSIRITDWFRYASIILLASFLPGYFILRLIDKGNTIRGFIVVIFSFLLSVFTIFLAEYVVIMAGGVIEESAFPVIVVMNIFLVSLWCLLTLSGILKKKGMNQIVFSIDRHMLYRTMFITCILIIVFLASYGLYDSHIIQDQRVYHGWAVLYKNFLPSVDGKIDAPTPLVYPIYLATLFSMTNLPTVNALSSLNMLNALPILAFYVLLRTYFKDKRGLPELGTFFAFLTGGFGWIFAKINLVGMPSSDIASVINASWLKTYDILTSDSFLFAGHPDITTPLLVLGLPSIFVLVYLVAPKLSLSNKLKYFLIFAIGALGLLAHPEILIIIVTLVLFFTFTSDFKGNIALLTSFLFVLLLDLVAPARYYSLITINLIGIEISLYLVAILGLFLTLGIQILRIKLPHLKITISSDFSKKMAVFLVCFFTYAYFLSYVIWVSIVNGFSVLAVFGYNGSVPWYFYPIKLGVVGLLALPSLVYAVLYLRRQQGLFIFTILTFVILILTPVYLEYRMIKYLHIILGVFAAFTLIRLFQKLSPKITFQRIAIIILMPAIIITAVGSPLLYVEYMQTRDKDYGVLPGRLPPSSEEYEALNWLKQRLNNSNETVTTLPRGTDNFLSEVVQFGGAWIVRTNLFYRFFEISDAENFITLAYQTNLKYIYLTDDDKKTLETVDTYADSYIRQLISLSNPAFNNTLVEIYEIPGMLPPTESTAALILPTSSDPSNPIPEFAKQYYDKLIQALALAGINYDIVPNYDVNLPKYNVIILPDKPQVSEFEDYLSWTAEGNQLIILEPQLSNVKSMNELNWSVLAGTWNISNTDFIQYDPSKSSGLITQQTFSNYSIEVSIRVLHAEAKDNHMGLMLNFQDNDNWDYLFMRENQLVFFRLRNGAGQEVWRSAAERLDGGFNNLRVNVQGNTFRFYLNDVMYGIFTDDNPLNGGKIGLRTSNLIGEFSNLTIGTIGSDYTANTTFSSAKLSYTSEKYGSGKILYLNSPLQIFENATPQEHWSSLNALASTINDTLQYYRQDVLYETNDIRHINYAIGNIQFSNATLFSSSVYFPSSLEFKGDVEVYKLEAQSDALILEEKYVNVEMDNLSLLGQALWELNIENAMFISSNGTRYSALELNIPFTIKIELKENATFKLLANNSALKVEGKKYLVLHVKELTWAYNLGANNPYLLVKSPQLSSEGQIIFESAHLSKGKKDVFVKEQPLLMTGNVKFNIEFSDGDISVISALDINAEIQIQEQQEVWNEWAIEWNQILLSPLNFLLLVSIIIIILISTKRRQTHSSLPMTV